MVTVDSKGRIVLPKDVRERLGLTPGAEVTVRTEDDRVVVEPEDDPDAIIEDLERRIEAAVARRERVPVEEFDAEARAHLDAIRRGAAEGEQDRTDE